MPIAENITVRQTDWSQDAAALRNLREAVFVIEQHVPVALEWDGIDAQCLHVLAQIDGVPVGTGRLLPDGHIGRMAVLREFRGRGIGSAMLLHLIELARAAGVRLLILNAQTHAMAFYRRFGFIADGETFLEAGISHIRMTRTLD